MTHDASSTPPDQPPLSADRQMHTLLEYSRLLASHLSVERLLPLTALRLARGVGVVHTKVLQFVPEHGDLLLVAGTGWRPGSIGTERFAIDAASPPGRSYLTRRPTRIAELANSGEFRYAPFMRDHGIRSLINAPVISGGAVWGVLELDSTVPGTFSDTDTRFLLAMANILGVAVERSSELQLSRAAARQAEEAARAAAAVAESHKVRLRDMQHRMKNNLAVIASMIQLERRQHKDPKITARLGDLIDRIGTISLAHEQMSTVEAVTVIDLAAYLTRLVDNLALQHSDYRFECEVTPVMVPLGQAIPLGLIVNELLTSATKQVGPVETYGLRISLSAAPCDSEATLLVSAGGGHVANPHEDDFSHSLVQSLVAQIGGIVVHPEKGRRCWEVRFPLLDPSFPALLP